MKAEELAHLIGTLSKAELTIVEEHIDGKAKLLNVYKGLIIGRSDAEISASIYTERAGNKYYQLKSRLLQVVLKVLAISNSNSHYNTKAYTNKQNIRQLIIDSEILYSRGLSQEGDRILKKAEAIALRYQYHVELYTIYDLLLKHKGKRSGIEFFEQVQEKKVAALHRLETLSNATYEYSKLMLPDYQKLNYLYEKEVYSALKELESLTKSDNIDEVKSMAYRARAYYSHINGDYDDALNSAIKFKELVSTSTVLKSNSNIAGASMQLAIIYTLTTRHKLAIAETDIALKHFVKKSMNELNVLNIRFVSGFVGNEIQLMKETLESAKANPFLKKSDYHQGLWEIRKAQYLFRSNSFVECAQLVNNSSALNNDKFEWRPGLDLFLVYLYVLSNDFDIAEYRLRALRRKYSSKLKDRSSQLYWTYKLLSSCLRLDRRNLEWEEPEVAYDPFKFNILSISEMRVGLDID